VEYDQFLKEGVCQDYKFQEQISKLLMFETSTSIEVIIIWAHNSIIYTLNYISYDKWMLHKQGELSTFEDYISRCAPEQKNIYYIVAPNRTAALNSPYYETFKKHKIEVINCFSTYILRMKYAMMLSWRNNIYVYECINNMCVIDSGALLVQHNWWFCHVQSPKGETLALV
jgi:HSP90 family molecular chaperone